jgi:hypothetical protein
MLVMDDRLLRGSEALSSPSESEPLEFTETVVEWVGLSGRRPPSKAGDSSIGVVIG